MKLKKKTALALIPGAIALAASFSPASAAGPVSARPALNGGAISADTAAGAPGSAATSIGSLGLDEAIPHSIGTGLVALAAPSGFAFGTAPVTVSVSPTSSALTVSADKCATSAGQVTVTAGSTLAFSVCSQSTTTAAHITLVGTSVQPTAGTPLASGDITLDPSTTALLPGVDGTSSFGRLQETVGALYQVTVSPSSVQIPVATTQAFTATPADRFGNARTDAVTWSADPAAGTISSDGVLSAAKKAATVAKAVSATAGSVVGTADVSLVPGPASGVAITPSAADVVAGKTVQFQGIAYDEFGNPTKDPVTLSADPAAGTLDSSGVLTATTKAGSYAKAVTASFNGSTATADLNVTPDSVASVVLNAPGRVPVGSTTQLTAAAVDQYGNPTGGAITYTVNTPAAGTITSDGLFTASRTAGTYLRAVTASAGSLSDSADIDVVDVRVPTTVVVHGPIQVNAGQATPFTAEVIDQFGDPVANPAVTWSTTVPGSIDANGVLTATSSGSFAKGVTAAVGDAVGSMDVYVLSGNPAKIELSSSSPTVLPDGSAVITARVLDGFGNPLSGYTVAFSIDGSGEVASPVRTSGASAVTNSAGIATFNYEGALAPGTETVNASIRYITPTVSNSIVETISLT